MTNADTLTTIIRHHLAGDPAVTVDDCHDVLAIFEASPIDYRLFNPADVLPYPNRIEQHIKGVEEK